MFLSYKKSLLKCFSSPTHLFQVGNANLSSLRVGAQDVTTLRRATSCYRSCLNYFTDQNPRAWSLVQLPLHKFACSNSMLCCWSTSKWQNDVIIYRCLHAQGTKILWGWGWWWEREDTTVFAAVTMPSPGFNSGFGCTPHCTVNFACLYNDTITYCNCIPTAYVAEKCTVALSEVWNQMLGITINYSTARHSSSRGMHCSSSLSCRKPFPACPYSHQWPQEAEALACSSVTSAVVCKSQQWALLPAAVLPLK